MLLFPLADAARYAGLHPRFAAAFAWLSDPAHQRLAVGRYALAGEELLAIIEEGTTHAANVRRFESHRRCIDIQVTWGLGEMMAWTPVAGLAISEPFAEGGDIQFYGPPAQPPVYLRLQPHWAVVFFPEDAHMPCLHPDGTPTSFRKVVIKVA